MQVPQYLGRRVYFRSICRVVPIRELLVISCMGAYDTKAKVKDAGKPPSAACFHPSCRRTAQPPSAP